MGWVQSADDDLLPLIIYTHVCTDRTYCGSGRCAPSAKTTEIRPQDGMIKMYDYNIINYCQWYLPVCSVYCSCRT